MNNTKIAIGGDHAGFLLKEELKKYLVESGYEIVDFGTYKNESVDYPDYAHPVAQAIQNKEFDFGILICGSANGVNMVANKYSGVRSALCWNEEIAELARAHNNANIIALPARYIDEVEAKKATIKFLTTAFEGGRHALRINKISK